MAFHDIFWEDTATIRNDDQINYFLVLAVRALEGITVLRVVLF